MSLLRLVRRQPGGLALLAAGLLLASGSPLAAPAQPLPVDTVPVAASSSEADLADLRTELERATAEAEAATVAVESAAARSAQLRHALEKLEELADEGRAAMRRRIRQVYMSGQPDILTTFMVGLGAPDLVVAAGLDAGIVADQDIVDAAEDQSAQLANIRRQAERLRKRLLVTARPALEAQDRARRLLAEAEKRAVDAAARAALAASRARLDAASSRLTFAVAPAVTTRGRRAAAAEAPIIELIERTCCADIPPGYRRTGQTISGIASWYGPGFVGNPTATGAPYDPERLTAAMLPPVPLGTVVRVTSADGRAVTVLINDRGPFGKGRVIDLSRAGSRIMGFDGLKQVTVELLEPV